MDARSRPVLVVGGTGFIGRRVVAALLADGRPVRVLARRPERAADLRRAGAEVVPGDMLDPAAVRGAVGEGARAAGTVVVCVHTLSRQRAREPGHDYIDVEEAGLRSTVEACRAGGATRLLYVTSIGVAPDAASTWLRGRWRTEQLLLSSGLDVTVLRPGMVVGRGGDGFGVVDRGARHRVAVVLATRSQRFRTIAVDDLARQLVDLVDQPASFGHAYDVGSDDVHTVDEMIELAAAHLGRRPPRVLHLPRALVARLAPLVERAAGMPPGALGGLVGPGSGADMVGDTAPLRALGVTPARPFAEALADALAGSDPSAGARPGSGKRARR